MKIFKLNWLLTACASLLFLSMPQLALGQTTDQLYTEIADDGSIIDGNLADIPDDKPIIRPTYMGKAIKEDVVGPDGPFLGFYDETPGGWAEGYYGHQYRIGTNTVMRNLGTYKGREIALKMDFTRSSGHWAFKVNLERDGAVRFNMDYVSPAEIRLVYNDGVYNTPVENVYVELPMLYRPTNYNNIYNTYDVSYVKASNLKRVYFTTLAYQNIHNQVSRETYRFQDTSAKPYYAEALKLVHDNSTSISAYSEKVGMTFLFDNSEPLVFIGKGVSSPASYATFFKSDLKTPGEIKYLPPRSKAVKNTDKFEAQFDVTQTLNDGYLKYYPDYLSVVMSDRGLNFTALHLGDVTFTDKAGQDISEVVDVVPINDHELEFRVKKADLIKLGSNQLNIVLSAEGLNSQEVMKDFDEEEGVYHVPMTFYNYKSQNNQKIISDEIVAVANIIPNIYGEAADGVEAFQYTTSGDLEKASLLKKIATTFPNDQLTIEIVDPTIEFNQVKTYDVEVKILSQSTNKEKLIRVPVSINEAIMITSDYLENQAWLINEVNRQLVPKKVDKDLYLSDLWKIKKIVETDSSQPYTGQHLPKTLASFKNLVELTLAEKKLKGNLPEELGSLTQLEKLSLVGNQFEGEIPESIGQLAQLKQLILHNNELTGKLPASLSRLTQLKDLNVSANPLSGQIPDFPKGQLTTYNISNSQLTYNSDTVPEFLLQAADYERTLVASEQPLSGDRFGQWSLKGLDELPIVKDGTMIRPFDSSDLGYFNLRLIDSASLLEAKLYSEHRYQIISQVTGKTVYEGVGNKDVTLKADVGEAFDVIMDQADKNPNNRWLIESHPRELKLIAIPKEVVLKLEIGDTNYQAIQLKSEEGLKVRDTRIASSWHLKVRPSELTSHTHTMTGSYWYINTTDQSAELTTGVYKTIERGQSDASIESRDISDDWDTRHGIMYKQLGTTNYKGNYQGELAWQLVDAPFE